MHHQDRRYAETPLQAGDFQAHVFAQLQVEVA